MNKSILIFLKKNKKFNLSRHIRYNNFINGEGDLDLIDKNFILRNKFEMLIKKQNLIFFKRYHKTGIRFDVLDLKFNLYSIDFLNGIEVNPIYFGMYKGAIRKKIYDFKFNFSLTNLLKIFLNIVSYLSWRIVNLVRQKPTYIEFFGPDGSGKTYYCNKIYKRCKGAINLKKVHLWNLNSKKYKKANITPYTKKKFNIFLSLIKELFLLSKIFKLFLFTNIFNFRKSVYLFERSCWDIVIDPERYRLNHKPKLITFFLSFFLKNSYKFFLDKTFLLIRSRKKEISLNKYKFIKKRLNIFFKKQKYFKIN